jgi:small conductance mechanosensitive channel
VETLDVSDLAFGFAALPLPWRVLAFLVIGLATHVVVLCIKRIAIRVSQRTTRVRLKKLQSLTTLLSSVAVFLLYFLLIGFVLNAVGVSLTAYLASASVVGLAVAFGSQGLVQDVVTGITLIFSDLIDVGDLVDLGGQTGIVRGITMRFVELENALGGIVYVPNRTISNVVNFPFGCVRCFVDVTLLGDAAQRTRMHDAAARAMLDFHEQFPALLVSPPAIDGRRRLSSGKEILRLVFAIWPNRGATIENALQQELVATLKREVADYAPWMVVVSYEIETRPTDTPQMLPWLRVARRRRDRPVSNDGMFPGRER